MKNFEKTGQNLKIFKEIINKLPGRFCRILDKICKFKCGKF